MKTYLIFFVICILRAVVKIECVQYATEGQFPYRVTLKQIEFNVATYHYAEGVIVSTRFVLTTARYISTLGPSDLCAIFNTINFDNTSNKIGVERITLHPSFEFRTMKNDIALVQTIEAFVFTEFVKLLLLPTFDLPVEGGTNATIAGWAISSYPFLSFTTTKTISIANCRRMLHGLIKDRAIYDTNVCTTNPVNEGISVFDYGLPLVDEQQFVVGLASWCSTGCGEGNPDVYTRVHPYVEWIDRVISSGTTFNSNTANMIVALIILQIFVNMN